MQTIYQKMETTELDAAIEALKAEVAEVKAKGLALDMARGKPSPSQVDISRPMLDILNADADLHDGNVDCSNYGCFEGIPSARKLAGEFLGCPAEQTLVLGSSSLLIEHDMEAVFALADRISVLIRTENEKEQAEPETLITPFLTRFVGRIKLIKDRLNVVPDHPVLKEVIKARPIKGLDEKQFAEGDWVIATLKRHGLTDGSHFAEISELITASEDPEAPWWVVLRRHDLARSAPATPAAMNKLFDASPKAPRKLADAV